MTREASGGSFTFVGNRRFTPDGTIEAVRWVSLAVDDTIPYVAFGYDSGPHNYQVEAWTYTREAWSRMGDATVSSGSASTPSMFVYNHVPFVAFADYHKANLKMFNGSSWEQVGGDSYGFSPGGGTETSLFIYNGVPYVAFSDATQGHAITVMKYE
jgi:hypothetical protein